MTCVCALGGIAGAGMGVVQYTHTHIGIRLFENRVGLGILSMEGQRIGFNTFLTTAMKLSIVTNTLHFIFIHMNISRDQNGVSQA